MPSIFGRAIIVVLTNKSGGSLAKGDVVILDSANDGAVTTTTTGGTTVTVGVVVEENGIANNATGRVQFGGYVALVTVNASVTRGHYGATHTVAKQAADAGASRIVGTFCQFLTGGTSPIAMLFTQPDASSAAGDMATDALWDAAGDLAQGTGANTGAKLSAGSAGQFLKSAGAAAANLWAFPPGHELDYVAKTSDSSITATTEATANTIITGNSVAYDGATLVLIEFFCGTIQLENTAGRSSTIWLYDGSSSIGQLAFTRNPAAGFFNFPARVSARITPSSASHTYSIRASVNAGTSVYGGGAGGAGVQYPMFMRITKV